VLSSQLKLEYKVANLEQFESLRDLTSGQVADSAVKPGEGRSGSGQGDVP